VKNKGLLRCGVLAGLLLLALLAAGGGAWWFFMGQYALAPVGPASPVQVFLLSPSSGDDIAAGDFALIDLQAVAPGAISWSEVFVDGTSLGAVTDSPERTSWTWRAWPTGVHVLSGRAQAADGQLGESQTVIVNVVAADTTMDIQAGASETLAQVGAKFGASPAQMAAANPKLDPSKPLADGQALKVPTGAGGAAGQQPPAGGGGNAGGSAPFLIQWELKLTGNVDKSYCYLSEGSGKWEKVPKQPFQFFGGLDNLYTQVFEATPPSVVAIQAQCWGWMGGALKYLGQGVTKAIGQGPIQVIGDGFQLTGVPQWPQGSEVPTTELTYLVPAPYALRTPKDAADCTAHAAPIVGPFICNTLMGASKSQYILLEWEWQPGVSLPAGAVAINDIAGYMLYEILPDTEAPPKYMKSVKPLGARAAAVPLPGEKRCYGVRAFADNQKYGGKKVSEMTTYCPGEPPEAQTMTLKPSEWITTSKDWYVIGCGDDYGNADSYLREQQETGFGLQPAIEVGSLRVDEIKCAGLFTHSGGVKFPQPPLPPGAVVQKALLKFSKFYMDFRATGKALGAKPQSCVATLGKAKQDWSGLNNASHFSSTYLATSAYSQPVTSLSQFFNQADVTTVVSDWVKNPSHNHGLILAPVSPPEPSVTGQGECTSGLGGFQLEILYLAP
jgi:hypothetical protein